MFKEVRPTSKPLPVLVAEEITQLVVDGAFKPGDRLPSEFELAQRLGVGRSTVREAIKLLVSQNVLEIHRGNGTFVCQHTGLVEDPLGFKFIGDKKKLGLDLCEVRFMLEPKVAMLAAKNATREEVDRMQSLCDGIRTCLETGEPYGELDRALHLQLAMCTRNSVFPTLLPVLNEGHPPLNAHIVQAHQAVVDAVRAHDGQAAYDAMWKLLVDYKRSIEALPVNVPV